MPYPDMRLRRAPRPENEEETSSGSAFVVSARGHLLTNYHVVEGCDTVAIARVGAGTIASRDVANDLALILAKPQSGFEPVKVRAKPARLGEEVIATASTAAAEPIGTSTQELTAGGAPLAAGEAAQRGLVSVVTANPGGGAVCPSVRS